MAKHCIKCAKRSRRTVCEGCETPAQRKRRLYLQSYGKAYEKTKRIRKSYCARSDAPRDDHTGGTRPKMCQACLNMPWNRPETGCPQRTLSASGSLLTCGLPFCAEERIERHVGGYSALYAAQKYAMGGGQL